MLEGRPLAPEIIVSVFLQLVCLTKIQQYPAQKSQLNTHINNTVLVTLRDVYIIVFYKTRFN